MLEVAVKIVLAYLVGDILGGDVLRRLMGGADLRSSGSGNVGATNALRTRGKGFALGVLLIDVGKGVVAALLIPHLPWPWSGASSWPVADLAYACGVAVALGHCFPVFHGFRGGKGVATLAGVFASLLPLAFPWMLLVFVVAVLVYGYVALASLAGAVAAVVAVAVAPGIATAAGAFALAMALLVAVRHHVNIRRLLTGREPRFERARLIGHWIDRCRGH
ncbi:MAG TPA: glycerol-3-phosphate 1-O-acyltransferase PlsY [Nevskiaceae bacterium]|nr:glycerol-3-phosphate 1-O-acyltransferase PlsY [Nevskiaceae bacterium]